MQAVWYHTFPSKGGSTPFTPWLDFIRNFVDYCPEERNPFIEISDNPQTKILHLNPNFKIIGSDKHMYPFVEEYWHRPAENYSWKLDFGVFIDNEAHQVLIECYAQDLLDACIKTYNHIMEKEIATSARR